MSGTSAMIEVMVGVSELPAALSVYRKVLGLRVEREWSAPRELAHFWDLDPRVRVHLTELSCEGYPAGRLRLARFEPSATRVVRDDAEGGRDGPHDIGPKALDFYTRKSVSEALAELEAEGCRARSRPIRYRLADLETEEVVLTGPDRVPLLLMFGHRHPPELQRRGEPCCAFSEVATVSVVVGDLEASRRFYGDRLGLALTTEEVIGEDDRARVGELTGTGGEAVARFLLYQAEGEASGKILLVCFGSGVGRRLRGRMRPGHLGISLFTHLVDDLETMHRSFVGGGVEVVRPPREVPVAPGRRVPCMLVRGPNEELFELRQRS